jgi:hypothetical protein
LYKIYRRIRFVRYKKRLDKKNKSELRSKELREQKAIRIQQREYKLSESQRQQIKIKTDRLEARKLKKDLREEIKRSNKMARLEWEKLSREDKAKARQELLEEKKQLKQLQRQYRKEIIKNFFRAIRSVNRATLKIKIKEFRNNAPKRKRLALISFNSTVFFLLSYFVLFLTAQAITVIAASFFDYPTTVYYYEVYFNISPEAWFHDSVKTIFSSGPLVNFIIGITFIIIYSNIREITGPFKLFFLWGFLHSVNMLFGAMLVGTLFETGVGHVISWMYIMDTGKVLYSTISIFLLVITGLIITRQFLISGNTYYKEMNSANRTAFIIAQVLLPYLAGNLFLILLRQPMFVFYDTFTVITLIIIIIPVLATYRTYNELYFEEEEKKPGLAWISMAVVLLLVLFFRVVLEKGIRFGG